MCARVVTCPNYSAIWESGLKDGRSISLQRANIEDSLGKKARKKKQVFFFLRDENRRDRQGRGAGNDLTDSHGSRNICTQWRGEVMVP